MNTFLGHIAESLLKEYGNNLYRHTVVFPNRRAGLYFNLYLSEKAGRPMWSPQIATINELVGSFSELIIAENEMLIFELYKVYKSLNSKAEGFDSFYFWGDLLLNDFDNIDKYLVDPERIFYNLRDLKEIDSRFGTLTEEQVEVIKNFWVNFNPGSPTGEKEGFLEIWNILPRLYAGFRDSLREKGLAYEGMIFRELAQNCTNGKIPAIKSDLYHFAGFNALNKCERIFLKTLAKIGVARFYWDYDTSFVTLEKENPAGYFIRQNLRDFGNDMPPGWTFTSGNLAGNRKASWRLIETSSDISQVKTISGLLEDNPFYTGDDSHHTAIVLADENLLVPLLTSLPPAVASVNITMGYPLKFNQVYTLVKHLSGLQKNSANENGIVTFDIHDARNISGHGMLKRFFEEKQSFLEIFAAANNRIPASLFSDDTFPDLIFKRYESPREINSWISSILKQIMYAGEEKEGSGETGRNFTNEFVYRTILALNRLQGILNSSDVEFSSLTYFRVLDKILKNLSVPFTGEPLSGLQIMGILETRALDFRNLFILSVNEGILPRTAAGASYIPHNLREAFGLPTIKHQDSIYAYYFYRLLQRAENVTFIYNSGSEGLKTGEVSRFMHQLSYLTSLPPDFSAVSYDVNVAGVPSQVVERKEEHIKRLEKRFFGKDKKMLTPSAVNSWLTCRMKFYLRYIAGIREQDVTPEGIDTALFGEILHSVMEKIYNPFMGKTIMPRDIEDINSDFIPVETAIIDKIGEKLYNGDKIASLAGNEQIVVSILRKYIHSLLIFDSGIAPFTITGLERQVLAEIEIRYADSSARINAGGIIDRTDILNGISRVVDYKTGSISGEIRSVASLFDPEDDNRSEAWFQVLMYCELLKLTGIAERVRPSVYAVRNLNQKDYSDRLIIKTKGEEPFFLEDYNTIRPEFSFLLKETIETIFSPDQHFTMTESRQRCRYCPYNKICRRI